jgi:nitronate monooxygenase
VAWYDTPLARLLGVRLPIVLAPMAGGPSTPRLAAAVSEAGGLGSLAGAMLPPADLRAAIRETRALTDRPFAVNLFAPLPAPSGERLRAWAELLGVPVPESREAVRFEDALAVLLEERVPVFSFTFGIPPLDGVDVVTIGTATTAAEAAALEAAGVDAVVAQGSEAGGHRGTFLAPVERSLVPTADLVPEVAAAVSVPVLASGGIMDGSGIAAALDLGAQGVQLGTAFLRADEAGTTEGHRLALGRPTTITRVMTGRHARAVRRPLIDRLEGSGLEPPDYPLPRLVFPDELLLAGERGALARDGPAGEIVAALEAETEAVPRPHRIR